jgi:hypothetical protein
MRIRSLLKNRNTDVLTASFPTAIAHGKSMQGAGFFNGLSGDRQDLVSPRRLSPWLDGFRTACLL